MCSMFLFAIHIISIAVPLFISPVQCASTALLLKCFLNVFNDEGHHAENMTHMSCFENIKAGGAGKAVGYFAVFFLFVCRLHVR